MDDVDEDIEGFGDADFGSFSEYTDSQPDHINVMDRGANVEPPTPSKSLTTKFMMRGMRGTRQYDVPQIGKLQLSDIFLFRLFVFALRPNIFSLEPAACVRVCVCLRE